MKIDSIKNYPSGYPTQKFRSKQDYEHYGLQESGNKETSVNTGYYSGSFTGKNEAAANSFKNLGNTLGDKIFGSKHFQKLLHVFEEETAVANTLVALVVAGMLRPATNLAMAGKNDKEDSIYAASHAMASAIIGFVISSIVMWPFNSGFKEVKENPAKYLKGLENVFGVDKIGKRKLEKSIQYKKLSKTAQMAIDTFVLGIPKAMLTIALIPPILKYVFHIEKGKNPKPEQAQEPKQEAKQEQNVDSSKYVNRLTTTSTFKEFEGGNK